MRRSILLALLSAFIVACVSPVDEQPWIEVQTANFQIKSSMSPQESVRLANDLELFRSVVQTITNIPKLDSPVPTKIYIFERAHDFSAFTSSREAVGYFRDGMRENYIVMKRSRWMDESSVIKHEFVHFLMNNATSILYPTWYSEGFAEFLSTVTLHEDGQHVVIGAFPMDRRRDFRNAISLPYKEIIAFRPGSELGRTMFYGQSWALAHWLQLGRDAGHDNSREATRYLELVSEGKPDSEAFEEAFGTPVGDLAGTIRTYLNGEYSAVAAPLAMFDHTPEEPSVRAMSRDEIFVALGELALSSGNERGAENFFSSAIALQPENSRAHAGLGDAFKFSKDFESAEPHFLRAIEVDPENAESELDYAEYLHDLALIEGPEARRRELLRDARKHYVRSYKLNSTIPETYAMYGKTFLAPGEDPSRAIEPLEHAHEQLPANVEILEFLAEAYVKVGRAEDARPLVQRIVGGYHTGNRSAKVEEILAELAAAAEE